jgi:hypothetical protein
VADLQGRPAAADHVLIEVLARASAEVNRFPDTALTMAAFCAPSTAHAYPEWPWSSSHGR